MGEGQYQAPVIETGFTEINRVYADCDVGALRPRFPWDEWSPDVSSNTRKPKLFHLDRLAPLHLGKQSPKLNSFLFELMKLDEERNPRDVNKKITDYVCAEAEVLFKHLGHKYPETFGESIVHLVGSVVEETKVGLFDEFDFMIELPALEKYGDKHFTDLKGPLKLKLCEQLFSSLPPCWKTFKDPCRQSHCTNAILIINVQLEGYIDVQVFCDIVFCVSPEPPCIPLSEQGGGIKRPTGLNNHMLSIDNLNSSSYYVPTRYFTSSEIDKLLNSVISENVRRVYRLVKLLLRECLPPHCDTERFRFGLAVPSYWLKQIVLYIMDEFPDPTFWHEKYQGLRTAQILSRLKLCLKKGNISTYFDPLHKIDVSSFKHCERQVTELGEILDKAAKGDDSALNSLESLRRVSVRMRDFLARVPVLCGLNSVIQFHRCWFQNHRSDTGSNPYSAIIRNYIDTYMEGEITLCEASQELQIEHNNVVYSLIEYQEKYLNDFMPQESYRIYGKIFPLKWETLYYQMFEEDVAANSYRPTKEELK